MMLLRASLFLLASSSLLSLTTAQFSCTFSGAKDASSCVKETTSNDHCVWCTVGGDGAGGDGTSTTTTTATSSSSIGFCVSESQAETIEQSVPNAHCDRYSDSDDDDDATPSTDDDDYNMPDDDQAPSDDAIPSDYWECLKQADAKSCGKQQHDCTWCDTPAGYGVCMAGPSAEAAKDSAWFTCADTTRSRSRRQPAALRHPVVVHDPMDPSCLVAYLQDQSEDGCTAAVDADGNPCEYCTLQGTYPLCLNAEQAEIGEMVGVTCDDDDDNDAAATTMMIVDDPMDPSCLVAFLQDQSADGCKAAMDADGNACEFCTLQGAFQLCLNEEQAAMGEQFGLECDDDDNDDDTKNDASTVEDPTDPSCLVAYLQDQSADGCKAAVDADGNPCEFCSLQGAFQLCLNEEQAAMGEQFGLDCDDTTAAVATTTTSPFDELSDCLEHYQEDDCFHSSCTWCNTQVGMGFCLTPGLAHVTKAWSFFDCEFSAATA